MGTRIKDAALVGSVGEGYKIPVSDGSNQPKTASVGQIGDFVNHKYGVEQKFSELGSKVGLIQNINPQKKVLPSFGVLKVATKDDDTLDKWAFDTDVKHYCTYEYKDQFNEFSGYAVVKYQGAGSMQYPKKGFRIDFFTDETYEKKNKIKFGGLIESNSYNLKGFYNDVTICRDPLINRIYKQAKETRPYAEMYPWNKKTPIFSCATGAIDGFPCVLYINNDFIGMQHLLLKKDAANFNLYESSDGLLYCCDITKWKREGDDNNGYGTWNSEFKNNDETKKDQFFLNFIDYINSDDFTKETASNYMDVGEWIDYLIFLEAFYLWDNIIRNIIIYSDDFVKFTPFLYDLDFSFGDGDKAENIDNSPLYWMDYDSSWLRKFHRIFFYEIKNRFKELLDSGVLSYKNVESTLIEMEKGIPYSLLEQDLVKYPRSTDSFKDTNSLLKWYQDRLEYLKLRFRYYDNEDYIAFYESDIENVLLNNIACDGIGITPSDARSVAEFSTWLQGNTNITNFNEFEIFKTPILKHDAFNGCSNLKSIKGLENLKSIGYRAFRLCTSLEIEELKLPKLNFIGEHAFNSVPVKSVIDLGKVALVHNCAFQNCKQLTYVKINKECKTLGAYAFVDCNSLEVIEGAENVEVFGINVFTGCSALKCIILGDSVVSIGENAFAHCTSLEYIIINTITPPVLGGWVFGNSNNCPIYVPDEYIDVYKTAEGWTAWASRIKGISEMPS